MEIKIHNLDDITKIIGILVVAIVLIVVIKEIGKLLRLKLIIPHMPPDVRDEVLKEQFKQDMLDTTEKDGKKIMEQSLESVCGAKKRT